MRCAPGYFFPRPGRGLEPGCSYSCFSLWWTLLDQAIDPYAVGPYRRLCVVNLPVKSNLRLSVLLQSKGFLGHGMAPQRRHYLVSLSLLGVSLCC